MVRILIEKDTGEREFEFSGDTVEDLLRVTDRLPHSYIVMMDGRPVPITEEVTDGAKVKMIKVASGG